MKNPLKLTPQQLDLEMKHLMGFAYSAVQPIRLHIEALEQEAEAKDALLREARDYIATVECEHAGNSVLPDRECLEMRPCDQCKVLAGIDAAITSRQEGTK